MVPTSTNRDGQRRLGIGAYTHTDDVSHLRQASQPAHMASTNGGHDSLGAHASSSPSSSTRATSQPSGLPDARMFKRSQRATWSCTECARRKIACDKKIPCQQCTKRGVANLCSRDHEGAMVIPKGGRSRGASRSSAGGYPMPPSDDCHPDTSIYGPSSLMSPRYGSIYGPDSGAGTYDRIPQETANVVGQLQEVVVDLSKRLHDVEDRTRHLPITASPPQMTASSSQREQAVASKPMGYRDVGQSFDRYIPRHMSSMSSSTPSDIPQASSSTAAAAHISPRRDNQEPEGDADTALTCEYLALGKVRTRAMTHQHYNDSQSSPPLPTTKNILSQPSTRQVPQQVTRMLIHDRDLDFVMTYAKDAVTWQHACVHTQTFQRELEAFQSLQAHERWVWTDPLWLALLFTIQCVAVHQMPPGDVQDVFGTASEEAPALLLDAALLCLETGRYLFEPSLYTCQALAVLCVTGHNVADSNLLSSHLGIGIKTAQMLGLHRLGLEAARIDRLLEANGGSIVDQSPKWRERIIRLELGKRIWWSLVQQDYFAMPFCGTSMVNPRQHDTPMPANAHDHELDVGHLRRQYEESDLTLVQKLRLTSKAAQIVYTFFESLPQRQPASLEEHVQPHEDRLLALLPATQPRSSNPSLKFGLALGRYMKVSIAHKVLVLHRAFCSIPAPAQDAAGTNLSTHTPVSQIQHSQARGLRAAQQILDQIRGINPSGRPEGQVAAMWTIPYQAVAASVVVALSYFRVCADPSSMPGCVIERREVSDARQVLQGLSARSTIAGRGTTLLDNLMKSFDEARAAEADSLHTSGQRAAHNATTSDASKGKQRRSAPNAGVKRGATVPSHHENGHASNGSAHSKRARRDDQEGDAVALGPSSADVPPAQPDVVDDGSYLLTMAPSHTAAGSTAGATGFGTPLLSETDMASMLQACPDFLKLFDGSMGNIFSG